MDLREELRRAQLFFQAMRPAMGELHQMFFLRSRWLDRVVVPDLAVQDIYRITGRTLSWRWDNRNPCWCLSPDFRDKIGELIRIAHHGLSLFPRGGHEKPTVQLSTYTDSHGETHYSDSLASALKLMLDQWSHGNDLLSNYRGYA